MSGPDYWYIWLYVIEAVTQVLNPVAMFIGYTMIACAFAASVRMVITAFKGPTN